MRLVECSVLVWVNACYFLWAYTLKYSLPRATRQLLLNIMRGNMEKAREYVLGYFPRGLTQPAVPLPLSSTGETEMKEQKVNILQNEAKP